MFERVTKQVKTGWQYIWKSICDHAEPSGVYTSGHLLAASLPCLGLVLRIAVDLLQRLRLVEGIMA